MSIQDLIQAQRDKIRREEAGPDIQKVAQLSAAIDEALSENIRQELTIIAYDVSDEEEPFAHFSLHGYEYAITYQSSSDGSDVPGIFELVVQRADDDTESYRESLPHDSRKLLLDSIVRIAEATSRLVSLRIQTDVTA